MRTGVDRMKTGLRQFAFTILIWTLFVCLGSKEAWSQTDTVPAIRPHPELHQTGSEGTQDLEKVEISTGFVFINGLYACPPYRIASVENDVSINGIALAAQSVTQPMRSAHHSGRKVGSPTQPLAGQVIHHLEQDALLIVFEPDTAVLVPYYQAAAILNALSSDDSSNDKVNALTQGEGAALLREQWASLVDGFEPSQELQDRIAALGETLAKQQEFGEEAAWYLSGVFPIMTILGFALAVLALGTLLSCRPPVFFSKFSERRQRMYCRQVVTLVGLIVLLNLYDLTCTLFAKGIGGFWEMNPFAGYMLDVPPLVICFKLCLTIGPAILLIVARRRKLAQMASWWGGVLYTVLILRWITYNAMFMH